MMHRVAVHLFSLLLVGSVAASATAAPVMTQLHGQTMGTTWSVSVPLSTGTNADDLRRGIQATLDVVDGQMSTYKPDSELSRFNRANPATWHRLSPGFFTVLQHAMQLAQDSDGAYDPTVGPLVNLWGFGPDRRTHQPPDPVAIKAARARVGWWKVKLDPADRRAFQPGGVSVDLSSVAKGYGVDQVGRYLQTVGVAAWLVEVGGELKGQGRRPDGVAWQVGIEQPDAAIGAVEDLNQLVRTVHLDNQAIATSGDYRHVYEDHGTFYSHHIDPRTGYPVPHEVASVSVLAKDCMQADPLGTALSVLGAERGMAFATAHQLAVMMLVRSGNGFQQRMSPAFAEALRQ